MTDNFRSFVSPKDDPDGAQYFRNVPLKRAGEPAEIGRACVFLCSGAADFINGTAIEVDGGMLPGVLYEAGLKPSPTCSRGHACDESSSSPPATWPPCAADDHRTP